MGGPAAQVGAMNPERSPDFGPTWPGGIVPCPQLIVEYHRHKDPKPTIIQFYFSWTKEYLPTNPHKSIARVPTTSSYPGEIKSPEIRSQRGYS